MKGSEEKRGRKIVIRGGGLCGGERADDGGKLLTNLRGPFAGFARDLAGKFVDRKMRRIFFFCHRELATHTVPCEVATREPPEWRLR